MKKLLVVFVGLFLVAIGVFVLKVGNDKIKRCTEKTIGTVIKNEEKIERDSETGNKRYYYPVVEYKANQRTIVQTSGNGSGRIEYHPGDKVDILYNPNKVNEFIIEGNNGINFISIMFIFVGGVFAVAGIVKNPEDIEIGR